MVCFCFCCVADVSVCWQHAAVQQKVLHRGLPGDGGVELRGLSLCFLWGLREGKLEGEGRSRHGLKEDVFGGGKPFGGVPMEGS